MYFAGLAGGEYLLRPFAGLLSNEARAELVGKRPKILVFGDSITSWTPFPESIAYWLTESKLEVEFVGPYHTPPKGEKEVVGINDLGVGGYTTIAFVRELGLRKDYGQPYRPEILKFFQTAANIPHLVVLEMGLNDVGSGFPEKLIRENLNSIIQFMRTKNPTVSLVLTGIPPFRYNRIKNLPVKIASVNKMYAQLALDTGSPTSRMVFAPYPRPDQARSLGLVAPDDYAEHTYYGDGIHPNQLAAKTMAYSVAQAIIELAQSASA